MTAKRVLLAGETWVSYTVEVKGFSSYSTGSLGSGSVEFIAALEANGHHVHHVQNHDVPLGFPESTEALSEFDVVILSDVPADSLQLHPAVFHDGERRPDRLKLIRSYVGGGGGLLMVGGYMSFSGIGGQARYQATALADVLPVEMLGYDDRVEAPEGLVPSVVIDHATVHGLPAAWPDFLGYNRLVAKTDATTVMTIGADDPFLVVGRHGAGRVAAFASDCSPHWGSPRFLDWAGYGQFWSGLVSWVAGEDVAG